jgi:hypothetical protein
MNKANKTKAIKKVDKITQDSSKCIHTQDQLDNATKFVFQNNYGSKVKMDQGMKPFLRGMRDFLRRTFE